METAGQCMVFKERADDNVAKRIWKNHVAIRLRDFQYETKKKPKIYERKRAFMLE